MSFVEAVAAKRDGNNLDRDQIAMFVRGATDGSLPREQLAAMLMAICCRGMDAEETRWLTDEMLHSGEAWNLAADRPEVIDKHSTGGVGDTVSLILAPLLSAVGVPVAMMAGRGLGHSQGTLDKLDAIPGWDSTRSRSQTLELVDRCGAAIIAQTDDVAQSVQGAIRRSHIIGLGNDRRTALVEKIQGLAAVAARIPSRNGVELVEGSLRMAEPTSRHHCHRDSDRTQ